MINAWSHLCPTRPPPRLLTLTTFSWRLKFTSVVAAAGEIVVYMLSGKNSVLVVTSPQAYLASVRAMHAHVSQLVWFRYLYLMTSMYLHANWLFMQGTN